MQLREATGHGGYEVRIGAAVSGPGKIVAGTQSLELAAQWLVL